MWTNEGPALYWDTEKNTVVPEGDSRAAFLLVAAGAQLPLAEAERYGLTDDRKKAAAEKAKAATSEEEAKAKAAQPNKAKQPPENKGS